MLQALNAGVIISKELLYKDVSAADRAAKGERAVLDFIDWELNGESVLLRGPPPLAAARGHARAGRRRGALDSTTARPSSAANGSGSGREAASVSTENGVGTILAWSGSGTVGGHAVKGGDALADELLITHDAAIRPHVIENTGNDDLAPITFFGRDINPDVPALPRWRAPGPATVS